MNRGVCPGLPRHPKIVAACDDTDDTAPGMSAEEAGEPCHQPQRRRPLAQSIIPSIPKKKKSPRATPTRNSCG